MFEVKVKNKDGKIHGSSKFKNKSDAIKYAQSIQGKVDINSGEKIFFQQPINDMIFDLKKDPSFIEKEITWKRKSEYPSIEECIEALLEEAEGNPEKLMLVMMKRDAVKQKYPK